MRLYLVLFMFLCIFMYVFFDCIFSYLARASGCFLIVFFPPFFSLLF